jgi:benzodiazapine receptor
MSTTEGLSKRARDPQLVKDETIDRVAKTRNYVSAQISKPGVKSLLIAVGIPLLLGSVNALFNSPFSTWFQDLKKPWWEPPGPIFGGAWSVLYPLMGLASWLVWANGGFHKQSTPLLLYVAQLFLNLLWPMLFFGWKKLGLALLDIILLDGVLVATISAFQPVNHLAANLMKPYLAWVVFATALNFNLWLNNRAGQPAQQQ